MNLIESSLIHQIAPFDETRSGPNPTLILLHGRGANEQDLLRLVPFLSPRLLCIAARAPFFFPYGGFTWYDLQEVGSPNEEQFAESYSRLRHFLDDVQQSYPVDAHQTFILGFSMGTVMAYSLALTVPERIKGVIAHSGYIPEGTSLEFQWKNLANTSFFVAHGVHDPVIPVEFGRKARTLLAHSNAPFDYHEYPIQHQISEESLRDLDQWLRERIELQK